MLMGLTSSRAQSFPAAQEIASEMTVGWNIGNTMEALYEYNGEIVANETAWGNAAITQRLIDSVKAVGFNTIRIPIAWDVHSTNGTIDAAWIARVKEVVDYCYNQDLYIMINIHWDNGWLEENCTPEKKDEINIKQANYWNQIANYFKEYDEHLLFASANEPQADDATQMEVLLSYHQTFINTVRATGGNNTERVLIVQGPRTDTEKTYSLMNTMPTDPTDDRLMVEVHFYPYQFSLMQEDADWGNQFYYWGACNHSSTDTDHNPTWGEEDFVDEQFQNMKTKFVDQGYPIILGEFGARLRTNLTGESFQLHKQSREQFLKYTVKSALDHGIIPVYWCAGLGELFDRNTGATLEPGTVDALMAGAYTAESEVNCGENDCQGVLKGHAYMNECGTCVLGFDASCGTEIVDCNGDINGSAELDNCGVCVGGNSPYLACTSTMEAEEPCEIDGVEVESTNAGFSGAGYANTDNQLGATIAWVIESDANQTATFTFRYANGGSTARPGNVEVNSESAGTLSFNSTSEWTAWDLESINIDLVSGSNLITVEATTDGGLANIDLLYLSESVTDANCIITSSTGVMAQSISPTPNPTTGLVTWVGSRQYEVRNELGQVLLTGTGSSLRLEGYPSGVYFLTIDHQNYRLIKD